MARSILALLAVGAALQAQDPGPRQPPAQSQGELNTRRPEPARNDAVEAPPEEDKSLSVTTYSFNPLQSDKDVRVGNYYFNRHNYPAAERRYRDATKWNEDNGDAWRRLGEAAEKSKDPQTAKEAYAKYLKLEPDAKEAAEIRKKLAKLK
jgi:tetratricopeptide (TPR) repeat protein